MLVPGIFCWFGFGVVGFFVVEGFFFVWLVWVFLKYDASRQEGQKRFGLPLTSVHL